VWNRKTRIRQPPLLNREGNPTVRPRECGQGALDTERQREAGDSQRYPAADSELAMNRDG
jgi:hypothetical protein